MKISSLQEARYEYKPKRPAVLNQTPSKIGIQFGKETQSVANQEELREVFKNTYGKPTVQFVKGKNPKAGEKLRVGVILSGGQAPGGHNVIAGLYDGIKAGNPESKLFGFLGGPSGLIDGKYVEIKDKFMDEYRNTGGFDMIGSGRTKIETSEQYAASINTAKKMKLDAVVIIGGDDSNTNAALLAERFIVAGMDTKVIGVPKTIDGDLKNEMIETSFGFDTATKTYSELIGNIERDANSAKKYWHFIKLMGRSASHIALECALQTQPNYTLISEEVEARKLTLKEIAKDIAEVVAKRSENGEDFTTVYQETGWVSNGDDAGVKTIKFDAVNAKYVRLGNLFNSLTSWNMTLYEFEIYNMPPAENLAEKKPADADCEANPDSKFHITDGKLANMWQTANDHDSHWATVDLGDAVDLDNIIISWDGGAYPKNLKISLSEDGAEYAEVYSVSDWNPEPEPREPGETVWTKVVTNAEFKEQKARYIRVDFDTPSSVWGITIYELEAYNQW